MKKWFIMVLFTLIAAPTFAQDRYIADKLFTYMHSGPSNEYRIIGSVDAGEKVQLVDVNKQTGFSEVVDTNGRRGWVKTEFITRTVSMAERMPKLEAELADVKEKLANAQSNADNEKQSLVESLDVRNKQVSELEKNYSDISSKLAASQSEIRELRAKLDTQKEDLLMKYFIYGGGVVLGGILFGLILPHIIPKRRKSQGDWL
ncbi:TIGR04211 family SH3 domain-containing protein [Vibrio sp.]|uniref:TIGR04211 family SH3 domain-containing protein n=1 Tax=Vibrio viridaestus TaxID=2487322 RepID=A0A3N9THN9_9VIBR|nr:TIGR04211 family SH3 domain-containing protein [Vibrio viridaestus]MDC0610660.1 TIGR04211 family SH3 domain-containing protein [Vibrio sp.]RQW63787.1 TIGR04211 family SH3 domain-containing protein [Vibrio viridaestus]